VHKQGRCTSDLQVAIRNMWNNDGQKVREIVSALSDEYSRKIMASTILDAKSPEQISQENGIPVSTCYRRIHDLVGLSMIQVSKINLDNGKKSVLYKSVYRDILVKFEPSGLAVELIPNDSGENRNGLLDAPEEDDGGQKHRHPAVVVQDCDLCQSKGEVCKVFVTGDSQTYLRVCSDCERRMHDRNTLRAVEALAHERMAHLALVKK
jgi:hypothetical protein